MSWNEITEGVLCLMQINILLYINEDISIYIYISTYVYRYMLICTRQKIFSLKINNYLTLIEKIFSIFSCSASYPWYIIHLSFLWSPNRCCWNSQPLDCLFIFRYPVSYPSYCINAYCRQIINSRMVSYCRVQFLWTVLCEREWNLCELLMVGSDQGSVTSVHPSFWRVELGSQ